jgi:archaellum biogenesis protein FlaJ (TadC family)
MNPMPSAERLFEWVIAAIALEVVVLLALWYRQRARWLATDACAELCAAGLLVAAAITAQQRLRIEFTALCLLAALLAHLGALSLRWRAARAAG